MSVRRAPRQWRVALRAACESAQQVRGHVRENRMTINYAIGRNSTEGRAHTMCIEGTQGTEGRTHHPVGALRELG